MAELIPNSFAAYTLTDRETLEGSVLNPIQTMVLQNHLSVYAEEKIALDYTPENKEAFLQKEAELKGKIQFIQYLLESSEASQEVLTNIKNNSGE